MDIQFVPTGTTCALCGREVPEETRKRIISAQYLTCNMDSKSPVKHAGEELRRYFSKHGVRSWS